jgi:hypothetical protein
MFTTLLIVYLIVGPLIAAALILATVLSGILRHDAAEPVRTDFSRVREKSLKLPVVEQKPPRTTTA